MNELNRLRMRLIGAGVDGFRAGQVTSVVNAYLGADSVALVADAMEAIGTQRMRSAREYKDDLAAIGQERNAAERRCGLLQAENDGLRASMDGARVTLSAADTESLPKAATRVVNDRDEWKRIAETATDTIRELNKEINQTRRAEQARGGADADRRLDNVLSSGMASSFDSAAIRRAAKMSVELSLARGEVDGLRKELAHAKQQTINARYEAVRDVTAALGAPVMAGSWSIGQACAAVRTVAERRDQWRERAEQWEQNFDTVNDALADIAKVFGVEDDVLGAAQCVTRERDAWRTRICDALEVRKDDPDALAQCCEALRWARATDAAHRSVLDEVRGALGTPKGADVHRWAQAVSETTLRHYRAAQELSESLTAVNAQLREATHREACYLARVLTVG